MSKTNQICAGLEYELRRTIVDRTHNRSLALTDELIGYTLYAADKQRQYGQPTPDPRRRLIAVPEFLTGLMSNKKV